MELVARGFDSRRIARELFLSDKTVRNHVSNVLTKIDVYDRAEVLQLLGVLLVVGAVVLGVRLARRSD
jgi:DNA-binding NarL/FixJ family response regulator